MKANIENLKCNMNVKHRREKHFSRAWSVVAYDAENKKIKTLLELSEYGTASMNYACLWILSARGEGSGMAGGYGYHRSSSAVSDAIESAGIELSADIGGVGDSAIEDALIAIGNAIAEKNPNLTAISVIRSNS